MRIIGGKFKGKKLLLPKNKDTRPLRDIVKESIFNIVNHSNLIDLNIKNSNILDLFSGSGSFGLECISRGAKKVIFIEKKVEAIDILKKNLRDFDNYKVIEQDCFKYFEYKRNLEIFFDIIFLDPPFKELKINNIIDNIVKFKLLKDNALMIIHRHKKDDIKISDKVKIIKKCYYGISKIYFCILR